MKKLGFTVSIAFVTIGLMLSSCEKELTKVVSKKFPDGTPHYIIYYDGEPKKENIAEVELYYSNGQRKTHELYKDGKQHGLTRSWYENGKPMARIHYSMGKKQGEFQKKHKNGEINMTGQYINGHKNGKWITVSEAGDTLSVVIYEKGRIVKSKNNTK